MHVHGEMPMGVEGVHRAHTRFFHYPDLLFFPVPTSLPILKEPLPHRLVPAWENMSLCRLPPVETTSAGSCLSSPHPGILVSCEHIPGAKIREKKEAG